MTPRFCPINDPMAMVVLAIVCTFGLQMACGANLSNSNSNNNNKLGNELNGESSEFQTKPNSGIKRYLFRDAVDADLVNTYKPTGNKEQWNTMRVGRLIDALAENLPTSGELQAPIYRTGRTYPSLGGLNFNQLAQTGAGSIISSNLLEQEGGANLVMAPIGISSQMQPLHGLVWAPPSTRPLTLPPPFYGSSTGGGNKSQKLISGSGPTTSGSRARVQHVNSGGGGGGGEFAFQTPELKRVENSRWNNLRGMWGKRSDNSINQLSSPAPDDAQLDQ